MLSLQKSASGRTGLEYNFSSPSIASTSSTVFVPPTNNVEIENNDVKKEIKNPRAKKGNSQKPKQKKQYFCHHCGTAGHTRPNCYKWLAT